MSTLWVPLLDAERRDRALTIVESIARALASLPIEPPRTPFRLASVALFEAYRARIHPPSAEVAAALLGLASERLAEEPAGIGLDGGLTGVAWMIEHVAQLLEPDGDGDWTPGVDEAVSALLDSWDGDFDALHGLAGIGVYALERGPAGRRCLQGVVARLRASATVAHGGVAWRTTPEMLPASSREVSPQGRFNLGVAHGTPGVVSLLARVCGESNVEARDLLAGSASWTIARTTGMHRLPAWVDGGPAPTRSGAWCYGGPGMAAALVIAAEAGGPPACREAGLALAHACRDDGDFVDDMGLCHGTAGLAHIYQRLHSMTGDPRCAEGANHWFDKTLSLYGVAGNGGFGARHRDDESFLTGAVGLGLALLAGCEAAEPSWDRLLMLAPPAPRS